MLNDLRMAIYNACKTMNVPVYDYWVTDGQFPYAVVGELSVSDTYYKLNEEKEITVQIHIFDKSMGKTKVNDHIETLRTAYKSIDGVNKRFNSRIIEDVEPNVMHGIVVLRLKI